MLVNEEIKLDYSDVLIRPKRSTMSSRGEVNLERTHTFLWSKKKWTGVPIMSANMATVGTPAMHKVLSKYNLITCPAKHHLKKGSDKFKIKRKNICWFGGIDDISKLSKIGSYSVFFYLISTMHYGCNLIKKKRSLRPLLLK